MASRDPEKLIEPFRTSIKELIKRANAQGIPAFITETTRTLEEQKENVRKGFSRTLKSKHLTGEAADIAFQVAGKLSYDAKLYERLYLIAKDLPFVIWPHRDLGWENSGFIDRPHYQYDATKKIVYNVGDMTCQEELAKEKKGHQETLEKYQASETHRQELITYSNLLEEKLAKEQEGHRDTLEKLTECERDREGLRQQVRDITNGMAKNLSLLDKIRLLLK